MGRLTLKTAFPHFEDLSLDAWLDRVRALRSLGVDIPEETITNLPSGEEVTLNVERIVEKGVRASTKRNRRFAGTDRGVGRGCYYSLCDPRGDDNGTLCRELFEYTDPHLPGKIFVSDSFDERLNLVLNRNRSFRAGRSGLFIVFFPPVTQINAGPEDQRIWNAVYKDLIASRAISDTTIGCMILGAVHEEYTIERVIDLRLHHVQEWFFKQFATGDGYCFTKPFGGHISRFVDMLPTLMHMEYGGTGTTDCIGNWMRINGVSALIYPSARSDASVRFSGKETIGFHGWSLVDYREALPLEHVCVDGDPWYKEFLQTGAHVIEETEGPWSGSWKVVGIEKDYLHIKQTVAEMCEALHGIRH